MIGLAGAELGAGWFLDGIRRDERAVAVEVPGEVVNESFGHVGDDGETTAHIAVEGAITDGEFAFVAGGEEEVAEFIGEGHEGEAAEAGLHIFFGGVLDAAGEGFTPFGS